MQALPVAANAGQVLNAEQRAFIEKVSKRYKGKKKEWGNNNSTLLNKTTVIDVARRSEAADIISEVFKFNQTHKATPIYVVPVSGTSLPSEGTGFPLFDCLKPQAEENRLDKEYDQSFSLEHTAEQANIVLRFKKKEPQLSKDHTEVKVKAGTRIDELEEWLHKLGYAVEPSFPTLHKAGPIGTAANGSYGPAKNHTSFTHNIVRMKIITPTGEKLTLSATENPELFYGLRDCHMGACVVRSITLKNVRPQFEIEKHEVRYNNLEELKAAAATENPLDADHCIFMHIPHDVDNETGGFQFRVTTMRDLPGPAPKTSPAEEKAQEDKDLFNAFKDLMTTELAEVFIKAVVNSETLRPLYPLILKAAAAKTFGTQKVTTERGVSHRIYHVIKTYTDLPLCDLNWLITVDDAKAALKLYAELTAITVQELQKYKKQHQYPLFDPFSRFLKGMVYPAGTGGVAPTAVSKEGQFILSYEFITHLPLAGTDAFKRITDAIVAHLDKEGYDYRYHPGKSMPYNVKSLTQIYKSAQGKENLQHFHNMVYILNVPKEVREKENRETILRVGRENAMVSPLIPPNKKEFWGMDEAAEQRIKKQAQDRDAVQHTLDQMAAAHSSHVAAHSSHKEKGPALMQPLVKEKGPAQGEPTKENIAARPRVLTEDERKLLPKIKEIAIAHKDPYYINLIDALEKGKPV